MADDFGSDRSERWSALRGRLGPLVADPGSTAILTDFDGTLSAIVQDPAEATLIDGAAEVLERLAAKFAVVAVVSGRPVAFLQDRLDPYLHPAPYADDARATPVQLVGLYGLEWSGRDGSVTVEAGAEPWREVVSGAVDRLRASAPAGVLVEPKGLTVTVHWRNAPAGANWADTAVAGEVERTRLQPHPGRQSVELRPPVAVDKGSVVRRLVKGCTAACYLGDDLGDLPAFAALSTLGKDQGIQTVAIAVADEESDPLVAASADVVVAGPGEALAALSWLADAGSGPPR